MAQVSREEGLAGPTELSALSTLDPPLSFLRSPLGTRIQVECNRTLRSTWLKSKNPSPSRFSRMVKGTLPGEATGGIPSAAAT